MLDRLTKQLPYVIVLLISGFLYYRATQFDFVASGERIGPDVWPKAILFLAMLTCAYEIIKNLCFTKGEREVSGVLESVIEEAPAEEVPLSQAAQPSFLPLLIAGVVLTIAYAALIDKLGFFVCTALFLAAFIWIGRYRRLSVILASSLVGSFAFMFMFMKVVYVSLPLGVGPFEQVSIALMRIMGIH